jgi:hemolysin activation/secretion protein
MKTERARQNLLMAASACVMVMAGTAQGQVVERNLPPTQVEKGQPLPWPDVQPSSDDRTPLGPVLSAISINGDPASDQVAGGLDVTQATGVDQKRLSSQLSRFLGQPLSRRLIAQAQTEIVKAYRLANVPLVSVTLPEQDLSSGHLRLKVTRFTVGQIWTLPTGSSALPDDLRVRPGDIVNTASLSTDLDRLNLYPFRQSEVSFSPGQDQGTTDLTLTTRQLRPWRIYGGYTNYGSDATDRDRYYAGALVGGLLGPLSLIGYQFTGSTDAVADNGTPFSSASDPHYVSHALRISRPLAGPLGAEANLSYVKTHQNIRDFGVGITTTDLSSALTYSSRSGGFWRLGFEARRLTDSTHFGDLLIYNAHQDVFQLFSSYQQSLHQAAARNDLELTLHISPGGMDDANSTAHTLVYSQGRMTTMRYAYATVGLTRETQLGRRFTLTQQLLGQYATDPLPHSEQTGIGGTAFVRGYSLEDGAFDSSIILRNDLKLPVWTATSKIVVRPSVFLDAGWGYVRDQNEETSAASIGLGLTANLGLHTTLALEAAQTLRDATFTEAHQGRLNARLGLAF